MNPPPLSESFAHIHMGTEPNAANLNYSLSTHLTPQAGLDNPTQEMTKSVKLLEVSCRKNSFTSMGFMKRWNKVLNQILH